MKAIIAATFLFASHSFAQSLNVVSGSGQINLKNTAMSSCQQQLSGQNALDVNPISGQLNDLIMMWNGSEALNVQWIELEFNSDGITGGNFQYQIAGAELQAILQQNTTMQPGAMAVSFCGPRVGGIAVIDPAVALRGNGMLTVYGTTADTNTPVRGQMTFQFSYLGN